MGDSGYSENSENVESSGDSEDAVDSGSSESWGESGDSEDWGIALYVEPRRCRGIRGLEVGEDWEIPEIGRLRKSGNRRSGENLYAWQKIRTSWNPGRFGRLRTWEETGNLVTTEVRRIGENRYRGGTTSEMWRRRETMSETWRVQEIGRFWSLEGSGEFGSLGESGE